MSRWTTVAPWRLGNSQNVAIGASSTNSTAVGSETFAVQVSALGNCHIAIGKTPTATSASTLVKSSDGPMVFRCMPGDKVAVIQDATATGNCNITELTH